MLKFTDDHEWLRIEGDTATVGITKYATEQLGDIVFVGLPEPGAEFAKGDAAAVVESVKAASDVFMPLDGTIAEVNAAIVDEPAKVNQDPQGDAWFFKITLKTPSDADALMDAAAYKELPTSRCHGPLAASDVPGPVRPSTHPAVRSSGRVLARTTARRPQAGCPRAPRGGGLKVRACTRRIAP